MNEHVHDTLVAEGQRWRESLGPEPDLTQLLGAALGPQKRDERDRDFDGLARAVPVRPVSLQPASLQLVSLYRARRRFAAMLGAAATVAAVAVGGAVWSAQLGHSTHHAVSGSHRTSAGPFSITTLPFATKPGSRWTITDPGLTADQIHAVLDNHDGTATLILSPAGVMNASALQGSGEPVRIDARPGRYIANSHQLVWRLADGTWASVAPDSDSMGRAALLAAARSLDFSTTTPLSVPFQLSQQPLGAPLTNVIFHSLHGPGMTRDHWTAAASWATDSVTVGVAVYASAQPVSADGGDQLTVDGHQAVWSPGTEHTLLIDLANGLRLEISESALVNHPAPTLTRDQAVAIAGTVTLAPQIEDRSTWFPATAALP